MRTLFWTLTTVLLTFAFSAPSHAEDCVQELRSLDGKYIDADDIVKCLKIVSDKLDELEKKDTPSLPLKVLYSESVALNGGDATQVVKIDTTEFALLTAFINGTAEINSATPLSNSQVRVIIDFDSTQCASDYQYLQIARSITFSVSGACSVLLSPGPHSVRFRISGASMHSYQAIGSLVVVAARKR